MSKRVALGINEDGYQKVIGTAESLREMKLREAAKKVEDSIDLDLYGIPIRTLATYPYQ